MTAARPARSQYAERWRGYLEQASITTLPEVVSAIAQDLSTIANNSIDQREHLAGLLLLNDRAVADGVHLIPDPELLVPILNNTLIGFSDLTLTQQVAVADTIANVCGWLDANPSRHAADARAELEEIGSFLV